MTHKRFKKFWTLFRLYLILRELKRRPKPPLGPLALVLLCFGCSYARASVPPAQDPIVVIMHDDGSPACSGFAIERNQVLTAEHCVRGRNDVEVMTARQWWNTASDSTSTVVAFRDRGRDLAVLSGEFNFASVVSFRPLQELEPLFARSVRFAGIADGNALAGAGFFRDTNMTIVHGWSGSPVFGLDGKVVGIVHSCEAVMHKCLPFSAQIAVLQ